MNVKWPSSCIIYFPKNRNLDTGIFVDAEYIYNVYILITACRPGTFGPGCIMTCGHCKAGHSCNNSTGVCHNGCQEGWWGDNCRYTDGENGNHYNNAHIQYTANFDGCKNDNFQMQCFNSFSYFCLKYNFWYLVLSMF